jgi:glycosyltransferase involved in cell wall biosynthesis
MGSVPEVMEQEGAGFIVNSVEEAAAAVGRCDGLNRGRCREIFEERFTAARMARDYLRLYEGLLRPVRNLAMEA